MSEFKINFYALKPGSVPFPASEDDLRNLNESGHDIYWTFNEFSDAGKRKKEDLRKIYAFAIDIDSMKEKDFDKIASKHLPPTLVIKTKRGFHVYWYLRDHIDCSHDPVSMADFYREFVKKRIVPVFKADLNACDACRLLRAPFFMYQKDGSKAEVFIYFDQEHVRYSLEELEAAFPEVWQEPTKHPKPIQDTDAFWSKANALPCRESILKLSGTEHVNHEVFAFKQTSGLDRLMVNGKPSNCWIDKSGMIGSTVEAGPAIPNFLRFYGHDWPKVASIIQAVFDINPTKHD